MAATKSSNKDITSITPKVEKTRLIGESIETNENGDLHKRKFIIALGEKQLVHVELMPRICKKLLKRFQKTPSAPTEASNHDKHVDIRETITINGKTSNRFSVSYIGQSAHLHPTTTKNENGDDVAPLDRVLQVFDAKINEIIFLIRSIKGENDDPFKFLALGIKQSWIRSLLASNLCNIKNPSGPTAVTVMPALRTMRALLRKQIERIANLTEFDS
ncbi:unnamed protein product, partial [marine sediment metagenome]